VDLRIDPSYVPDMNQRLMLYRKVASARRNEDLDSVLDEALDRYGPLPESVLNLADYGRIRVMADRLGAEALDRDGRAVVIRFRPQARIDPARLVALVRQRPDLALLPPATLKMDLGQAPRPGALAPGPPSGRGRSSAAKPSAGSWWTATARAGVVRAGFNKEEVLRSAREDPRAPGGLFDRVGGLLSELLE
jgi:transcription-repair coupling factor (superfamily II helicase)